MPECRLSSDTSAVGNPPSEGADSGRSSGPHKARVQHGESTKGKDFYLVFLFNLNSPSPATHSTARKCSVCTQISTHSVGPQLVEGHQHGGTKTNIHMVEGTASFCSISIMHEQQRTKTKWVNANYRRRTDYMTAPSSQLIFSLTSSYIRVFPSVTSAI